MLHMTTTIWQKKSVEGNKFPGILMFIGKWGNQKSQNHM